LFSGTVYDNIAYGSENATPEGVKSAAKSAHIDHFIETLENGYDTLINEESSNISGGQKQLLTIARAYLSDRKMLILDEATSNVDTRTEIFIQQSMDELMKGRTSFVIAHRLSTIVNADVILVVNDGQIVEQGTHSELLSKGGFYSEIYYSQYDSENAECRMKKYC
jgi:ATP-binding cassette subfamily B protein